MTEVREGAGRILPEPERDEREPRRSLVPVAQRRAYRVTTSESLVRISEVAGGQAGAEETRARIRAMEHQQESNGRTRPPRVSLGRRQGRSQPTTQPRPVRRQDQLLAEVAQTRDPAVYTPELLPLSPSYPPSPCSHRTRSCRRSEASMPDWYASLQILRDARRGRWGRR